MNRESTCGGGNSGQTWQTAFAQVKSQRRGRGIFVLLQVLNSINSKKFSLTRYRLESLYLTLCFVIQVQKTASLVWQLMFLHSDGQVSSMSIREAQRLGYSLTTSAQRVVLRSGYKQQHAELTMVGKHVGKFHG